jgi:hypothetical protein
MLVDEKMPFSKAVKQWIFQQSAAVVISLLLNCVCLYTSWLLWQELKEVSLYQRTLLESQLQRNTSALEKLDIYLNAKNSK